jgi:hypothetical protein
LALKKKGSMADYLPQICPSEKSPHLLMKKRDKRHAEDNSCGNPEYGNESHLQ